MPQICPQCGNPNRDTAKFCIHCRSALSGLLSPGTQVQGRYEVTRLLGCGGMGAVYLAMDTRLGNRLALKENFDNAADALRQFETEAQLLAKLSHPNLPRVTDYFVEPSGRRYLVMDYVEGEDLQKMVEDQGPLPVSQVIQWSIQILDALEYLHSQIPPVIHRDIKPANVRITPAGKAMLVDFGISKASGPTSRTATGARAVSPGFSPVEQYGGGRTEARSDIYALGATLYCALTGEVPPESMNLLARIERLTPPSQLNRSIPAHVEGAILKAMHLQTDQRHRSAAEMRLALQAQQRPPFPAPSPASLTQAAGPASSMPTMAYPHAGAPPLPQYIPPARAPAPTPAPIPQRQPAQAAAPSPTYGLAVAGHGSRIGALLIDGLLCSLFTAAVSFPFWLAAILLSESGEYDAANVLTILATIPALAAGAWYYVHFHAKSGQTPGKKAMHIKVVDEKGNPISKTRAFWRWVVFAVLTGVVSGLLCGLGFLIYLLPLFNSRHRALHDILCGTLVVEE